MNVVSNNFRMKNNADVQKAIDKIVTEVCENLTPEPEQRSIFDQTLKLLANGSPVKPTDTAKHLKTSPDKVISALKKFGAEFDQDGNILGLGLTLVATPHIYEFDGRKMYTWCAADALLCPVILKQTVRIESPDPVTGKKIQVHVTPDKVETIEPNDSITFARIFKEQLT